MAHHEDGLIGFSNSEFFKSRIDMLLDDKGMDYKSLADLMGVTPASITRMLQKGNPSLFNVLTICKVLGTDIELLLEGYEDYV